MTGSTDTVTRSTEEQPAQLEHLLDWGDDSAASLMRSLLQELLAVVDPEAAISSASRIKKGVHRLRFGVGTTTRSIIVKRLDPDVARRNQAVITRWLPAVGMQDAGPTLLGTVAEPPGRLVWHIYEDLGEVSLNTVSTQPGHVERGVAVVATLHMRFAGHPLLGECRLWGGDLGMPFYHSNVVDAMRALEAVKPQSVELRPEHLAARDSLLTTLEEMLAVEDHHRVLQAQHGGAETLLHGDLWHQNLMVVPNQDGSPEARLIDWDHAGVGQVGYDLSTFLGRFAPHQRRAVLDLYRAEVAAAGWRLPGDHVLKQLFDIAERSRIANRVIWPALEIRFGDDVDWGLGQLIELCRWFDRLEPVLP